MTGVPLQSPGKNPVSVATESKKTLPGTHVPYMHAFWQMTVEI